MSLGCYCSFVVMNSMTRDTFTYNKHSSICSIKYPPKPNSAKQQSICYCCNCKGTTAGQNGYCPWTGLVYAVPSYFVGMSALLYTDIVENIIYNKVPGLTGGGLIQFSCDKCNTFNEYAEPNMPGNIYRCYSCRNR